MGDTVFLSLGSNLGDRENNLKKAIQLMKESGIKILKESSVYETEPMYYKEQSKFLNQVIKIETELSPLEFLDLINKIEKKLKRKRLIPKGPRTIDIDIILWEDKIINDEKLKIPHPLVLERDFVIKPLLEIEENIFHPLYKKKVKELINSKYNFSAFLCDVMLGDVAKWLRLLGFKVSYGNKADDKEIVYRAKRENYLILTKDRELSEKKNIKAILVESNELDDMIIEILKKAGVDYSRISPFRYCPLCGKELEKKDKEEVRWFIPQRVYEELDEFYVCKDCFKVYWKGTHYQKIIKKIQKIRESVGTKE